MKKNEEDEEITGLLKDSKYSNICESHQVRAEARLQGPSVQPSFCSSISIDES